MNKKEKMSFAVQIKNTKLINGLLWILTGICTMFSSNYALNIKIIVLLISINNLAKYIFAKKEEADEMAEENLHKAKSAAADFMYIVMCIFTVVALLMPGQILHYIDFRKHMSSTLMCVMGVWDFTVGFVFMKLESE